MMAYFVQHQPDVIFDLEKTRELVRLMDVDEIHFFNKQGEIFSGTHPEYYGYTVEDGEQIGFFKQMLEDTSLKICQDMMPNTAEAKEMQYAAVWLADKSSFVEIGMNPERLLALMEENSLQKARCIRILIPKKIAFTRNSMGIICWCAPTPPNI